MLESIDIAKFLSAFVITIFLILSVYYIFSRYGKNIISLNQKGDIKIKDMKFLGKGKNLLFIEVKDKEFLLSVDEKEIKVIDKWDISEKNRHIEDTPEKHSHLD